MLVSQPNRSTKCCLIVGQDSQSLFGIFWTIAVENVQLCQNELHK